MFSESPRLPFGIHESVTAAVERLASSRDEDRGAVFTRREVVDFMLDLAGYTSDRPLAGLRLLEPSFGAGDFLEAVVERLVASWRASGGRDAFSDLADAIVGVEVHRPSHATARRSLAERLVALGIDPAPAERLVERWLAQDDFLLADLHGRFDFVVGNPPYVRQDMIDDVLVAEYRVRYSTIFDRADVYVPFIQRSLDLLKDGGTLSFICPDRWTKNRYGGPLRDMVARDHHLRVFVDMNDTPAFKGVVASYPAIFVIDRARRGETSVARRPAIDPGTLGPLAAAIRSGEDHEAVLRIPDAIGPKEPWMLDCPRRLALVRRMEARHPTMEQAGCRVGIGVATGADAVYIDDHDALPVEESRKLPLAMRRDIADGRIEWKGKGVINPFDEDGSLVDLRKHPMLASHLQRHESVVKARNCAKKNPRSWFRTIDRIQPQLASRPKLLIPDIAGSAEIVYEDGRLYPHHNLYYVVSDEWDLHALRAVLVSGIAKLFVEAYSTSMRGGYLRYQAQYLRRIRIPAWNDVPTSLRSALSSAGRKDDVGRCERLVAELYGLSEGDVAAMREKSQIEEDMGVDPE